MEQRYVLTPKVEQFLPLFIESVGSRTDQEKIIRDQGYPFFHWIQTTEGEGEIKIGGIRYTLPQNTGVLLFPYVAHSYGSISSRWSTQYLTFDGPLINEVLTLLGFFESTFFRLSTDTLLHLSITRMLMRIKTETHFSGSHASADLYSFLMNLKNYGQTNDKLPFSSSLSKLQPLLDWLEYHYGDPNIGLNEMAANLKITSRHLNTQFRQVFGHSPYAYLIMLRIRKSKELLLLNPSFSVKKIAEAVGFRDTSHFVATFRKYVGFTPEQFRQMN
jgi:AraC family transcriptional regulator of arabinose operon